MTPEHFSRDLAATLAASLPEGFTASADGVTITIETPEGEAVTTALDLEADDSGDLDAYADAAESVLSLAQDVVCEALDATWPSGGGNAFDLPIPGVRVEGTTLHLFYGDDDAPVLTLRHVTVASPA